jgi:heptosyltransferase III
MGCEDDDCNRRVTAMTHHAAAMKPPGRPTVVIFRIGSIGDTVVALPCLQAVARAFPNHDRILLTNIADSAQASSAESVLQGSGLIDGAIHFPPRLNSLASARELVRRLAVTGARTLVYLAPRTRMSQVWRDCLFFRLAGIRSIIGAPAAAAGLRRWVDADGATLEYEAQFLARSLQPRIPVDLSANNWDLKLSAAEHETARSAMAGFPAQMPVVAICPGAKWAAKNWGEANWGDLLGSAALQAYPVAMLAIGARDEHELSERVLSRWNGPVLNLCGRLSPRESAAVLKRCELLICHDSGPMHLATTQATACVALFGTQNQPRQWFPWGEQHRIVYEPRGIAAILVEAVVAEVVSMLRGHGMHSAAESRRAHLRVVR